ncbi:MAG TPA: hypothetical protein VMW55_04615 [Nitrosopumilaceae archaeon]|nr:hypothetical protein [Nitrosopumilaceae archaeon]
MNNKISRFNSIIELKESLDERIKDLDEKINLQSKIIGDKIRVGEQNNSEELSDLKEKLNPENSKDKKSDNKKSENKKRESKKSDKKSDNKRKPKKGKSENWIDYEGLHLYNGIGTRGELELYFKSLEGMKAESERLKNIRDSLEQLMKSGIKKELAGVGYEQNDGPYELAFIKTDAIREKFSFKSILTVGCE